MPDWSYHGFFRPLLFRLPARTARDLTLGAMGALARLPGGAWVIRTMGHMERYPELEAAKWGIRFPYPVGVSGELDVRGAGRAALAQIGFGFIEVGPVTLRGAGAAGQDIRRDAARETIVYPERMETMGLEGHLSRLHAGTQYRSVADKPHLIRTKHRPGASPQEALEEQLQLIAATDRYAAGFYIDGAEDDWPFETQLAYWQAVANETRSRLGITKPLFLYLPLDYPLEPLQGRLSGLGYTGVALGDGIRTERGFEVGPAGLQMTLEKMARLRAEAGSGFGLIASGGVHEPEHALQLLEAGADLVQLHSGLVYAGPGLPKRINEAILHERLSEAEWEEGEPPVYGFWRNWGWMSLLGIGMIVGGILAWLIAATTVLLPYDETFLGMERGLLAQHNGHLLPFMSHDRVTLAGTMISIGFLYVLLATFGLQYNLHWARTALNASATVGFLSFFLYLGYGYFDPIHAAAAILLLPMFLFSLRGVKSNRPYRQPPPNRTNDRLWRRAQIGQLLFVVLGGALAVGGLTIAGVGITRVFVSTDLAFLGAAYEQVDGINPRLVALIAHDRAGFGGALFSNAIAVLATALWGIQQGHRWVWRMLLLGGLPGFAAGLSVHAAIGYTDFVHLLPAYVALALYAAGLVLLYPYLHTPAVSRKKGVSGEQEFARAESNIADRSLST